MDFLRSLYVLVLGLLFVLSGCFGLSSDSSADDDSSNENNLAPVVTASWMGDSTPTFGSINPGWNVTVYHAMTDWDGSITNAGWDINLDGTIDYPIYSAQGLTTIFIPENSVVNSSLTGPMTSILFGALDDDGAWSSSPLITLRLSSLPSINLGNYNTYTAEDAADDANDATGSDDTLIKMQMTGSDTLAWSFVDITLSVGDNYYTCSVAAGDDCVISQQAGDNDNAWEPGEYIFLSEADAEICSSSGCMVDISVTSSGNTVAGDGAVAVN
ncbi:MAG: hypothetical protein CMO20_06450 [Thermoplasmata archaeon]|nr:hypothetical protein [Thermoplasmata archaeon]